MDNLFFLVLCMGIVTYIPRLLPMVFLKDISLPPFINRFLKFIPYAALGSLIFPGFLTSTGSYGSAIVGGLIAIGLSYNNVNLMLVVLGAIAGAYFGGLF